MTRSNTSLPTKERHRKILKLGKGYVGRSNCIKIVKQKIEKGLQYSYRDRRVKKRTFKSLWIVRLNAALREKGLIYSKFINQLKLNNVIINRKMLSELAINSPESFANFIQPYLPAQ